MKTPDKDFVINNLLQEVASLNYNIAQLKSVVAQYEEDERNRQEQTTTEA